MKLLQICIFDSDFYLQQVRILHLDVKVKNVQLRISTSSNLILKIKSRFSKFSNFLTKFFSKLKKFQNFVDVTAIWLFFDDNDFCTFSAHHLDTVYSTGCYELVRCVLDSLLLEIYFLIVTKSCSSP